MRLAAPTGRWVIHLEIGETDFDTPANVRETAKRSGGSEERSSTLPATTGHLPVNGVARMTAWRAKLGFLVPSSNSILERDARLALPDGVSAHFARMKQVIDTAEELASLADKAPDAADLLADAEVDAIAFGCTTGSLLGGLGYDERLVQRIESRVGIPATTTSTAVVHAFRHLGRHQTVLVSPYEAWLNDRVVEFLHANGIEVGAAFGFALPEGLDCEHVTPQQIRDAAVELDSAATDSFFISCTAFRGLEAAELIEGSTNKPVVTSNQATFWELLQMVGIDDPVRGFGRLLAEPRSRAVRPTSKPRVAPR